MRRSVTLGARLRAAYYYCAIISTIVVHAWWAIASDLFGRAASIGPTIVQKGARRILRFVRIPVTVRGKEHIPEHGGLLVICNHQSHMDGVVLTATFPRALSIVAKEELFKIPIFGRGLRAVRFVKINRDNPRQAVATMNAAAEFCRDGGVLLVFPEGTRTEDGELQEFKRGAAQLAIKGGVPVLPMAIAGTRAILPAHSLCTIPGPVCVQVGKPIPTADLGKADRRDLAERMQATVAELRAAARAELPAGVE